MAEPNDILRHFINFGWDSYSGFPVRCFVRYKFGEEVWTTFWERKRDRTELLKECNGSNIPKASPKHAEKYAIDTLNGKLNDLIHNMKNLSVGTNKKKFTLEMFLNCSPCALDKNGCISCTEELINFKNKFMPKYDVDFHIKFSSIYKPNGKEEENFRKLVDEDFTLSIFNKNDWDTIFALEGLVKLNNDERVVLDERLNKRFATTFDIDLNDRLNAILT